MGSVYYGPAGGTVLYLTIRAGLTAEFDESLEVTAEGVTAATEQENGSVVVDFTGDFMHDFERQRQPDYYQIWLTDSTTLKRSPSLKDADLPHRVISSGERLRCWNLKLPDGRRGRAIGMRFAPHMEEDVRDQPMAAKIKDPVILVVARHRAALDHQLRLVAMAIGLVGALLAAMTGFGVPAFIGRSLQPLEKVAEHAATIDAHSLQLRFAADGLPTELRADLRTIERITGPLATLF